MRDFKWDRRPDDAVVESPLKMKILSDETTATRPEVGVDWTRELKEKEEEEKELVQLLIEPNKSRLLIPDLHLSGSATGKPSRRDSS